MWSNDLLQTAREQQLMINSTPPQSQKVSKEELLSDMSKIVKDIESIQKLKMISRITTKLANVAKDIHTLTLNKLDLYLVQHKNDGNITDIVMENIRAAIYRMVTCLSDRDIRVSIDNNKHRTYISHIEAELKKISQLLHDDNILLDVEMDCSRDEEIARQMAGTL